MPRATVHRYVSTLVALDYLEQLRSRRYRLGPRAGEFGMSVLGATGLRGNLRTHLKELRSHTALTASIAVLDNTAPATVTARHGTPSYVSVQWVGSLT